MRVQYKLSAIKQLEKLPPGLQERITGKIDFYAAQADPLRFAKRLAGYDAYRFRIGDYRAVFDVNGNTLEILLIVKREGAYRDL